MFLLFLYSFVEDVFHIFIVSSVATCRSRISDWRFLGGSFVFRCFIFGNLYSAIWSSNTLYSLSSGILYSNNLCSLYLAFLSSGALCFSSLDSISHAIFVFYRGILHNWYVRISPAIIIDHKTTSGFYHAITIIDRREVKS